MKLTIKVFPRSSQRKVVKEGERYKVYVHESATDGKANDAVRELLAEEFGLAKSRVMIIQGEKNRNKIIELRFT